MESIINTIYVYHIIPAACLLIGLIVMRRITSVQQRLTDFVSAYLCMKFPIKDESGKDSIPTCPYIWPNGQGDVGKFLEGIGNSGRWEKEHGNIYRIWSGMTPEIVLTQPNHIQIFFKDSDSHIKAKDNNSGYIMSRLLGRCVGLISQEEWKKVRSATELPFIHSTAVNYIALMRERTEEHFNGLVEKGRLAEGLIDPAEDLKMLPFWIVAEIIYGKLSLEMERYLVALIPTRESLFSHVISGGMSRFWWSQYLPTYLNRTLSKFKRDWAIFNDTAYQRLLAEGRKTPIVGMYEEVLCGSITQEQLYQTLDEILFANLDVTLGGISWNLVFLAANKGYQRDIKTEMADIRTAEDRAEVSWEKYIKSTSTLLAASIFESSRLRPLAAFSVPQAAPTDRTIGGFLIPAGTNVIVDSYALNIRNSYWGPDSSIYNPRRFLQHSALERRYHFWRFGFGPRTCMGKYVADLILRVLLSYLLENFELSFVASEGKEWERNSKVWITHPQTELRCEKVSKKAFR